MSVTEQCPTCGAAVRVVGGDEGTSHYEPITAIDALAKEVAPMAEQLRGAVDRIAELEAENARQAEALKAAREALETASAEMYESLRCQGGQ